jgi:hypothetical protein
MTSNVSRIRINRAGVKALLNGSEVDRDLRRRAEAVKASLPTNNGERWEVVRLKGDRISYMVRAANTAARRTAATSPALQRALGAGR